MQTLNIEVKIPDDHVLVEKSNYEELITKQLIGKVWGMKDLEKHVGRNNDWLKEKILYPHREELEEFVTYPTRQGERWRFGALRMSEWLEENQEVILCG